MQEFSNVKQSIEELGKKATSILQVVQQPIDYSTAPSLPGAGTSINSSGQYKSYSEALSKNISDVIKISVADSIKSQKKAEADESSLAVYGLPEEGDDSKKVRDVLTAIGCHNFQAVIMMRIGRFPTLNSTRPASTKGRPFNLLLTSAADCSQVLGRQNACEIIQLYQVSASPNSYIVAKWRKLNVYENYIMT